jgi:hypothetical protein
MHNEIPPEMRNRQQFPCDTCGKVFLSRMGVNNHIRLVFTDMFKLVQIGINLSEIIQTCHNKEPKGKTIRRADGTVTRPNQVSSRIPSL